MPAKGNSVKRPFDKEIELAKFQAKVAFATTAYATLYSAFGAFGVALVVLFRTLSQNQIPYTLYLVLGIVVVFLVVVGIIWVVLVPAKMERDLADISNGKKIRWGLYPLEWEGKS